MVFFFGFSACGGGTFSKPWTTGGKCHALENWFSQFEKEYPRLKLPLATRGGHLPEVANLFRDQYFVPVFGISYEADNAEKLKEILVKDIYPCITVHGQNRRNLDRFATLQNFFSDTFYFNQKLAAMVTDRDEAEQWLEKVRAYTEQMNPTEENVREIEETYLPSARRNLAMLYPSEQREILNHLENRKGALKQTLLAASPTPVSPQPDQPQDSEAQTWFEEGLKLESVVQFSAAAPLYERAAQLGHSGAKTQLGYLYQTGTGVTQDARKAFTLYSEAARDGYLLAQFHLAVAYINGVGTLQDPSMARQWLTRAAEGGHQQSQLMLGLMVQQGVGGEKNEFTALRWLQKASEGRNQKISGQARDIKQKIEEKVLFSGAFRPEEILAMAAVGFGFLAIMVNNYDPNYQGRSIPSPYDPQDYQKSWVEVAHCLNKKGPAAQALNCF